MWHGSKAPECSIEAVLMDLGAVDVPFGTGWVRMRCPFHSDRRASAAVNHELNAFSCQGCGVKGDGYALLMSRLGLGFPEAKERAMTLCGEARPKVKRKRRVSELLGGRAVNDFADSPAGALDESRGVCAEPGAGRELPA